MHTAFEALFSLLEEEIVRQETVLAATRRQGEAARARDMKALEEQTASLMALAQEAAHADAARKRALRQILGVGAAPGAALSEVIALAPEPYASHLRDLRTRLRLLLNAVREETRANTAWMRMSLKVVGRLLSAVEPYLQAWPAGYGANGAIVAIAGQEPASSGMRPALIDRKG